MNNQIPGDRQLNLQESLQELEYCSPVHWRLGGADASRYRALSRVIALEIARTPAVIESRRVHMIDLGCGDGAGTAQVATFLERFGINVYSIGIDCSHRAIEWAMQMTEGSWSDRLKFIVASADEFVLEKLEDFPSVVVMREVIEHLTEIQFKDAIERIRRQISDGYLVVTTPTTNSPTEAKHYRHYDAGLIRAWIESNGLCVEEIVGFAFRPRCLYSLLSTVKVKLNARPALAWIMTPFWRKVPIRWAQTGIAVASWREA